MKYSRCIGHVGISICSRYNLNKTIVFKYIDLHIVIYKISNNVVNCWNKSSNRLLKLTLKTKRNVKIK